jgi:exopolyphosphatase / guanosine-5'-triphosphate,3'-diphosphate pyrophosphatase
MRLGVIDVGSNTVHLLVVDARQGGHPWPVSSEKATLRLAERIDGGGRLSDDGAAALVDAVRQARRAADEMAADDVFAFATSAVRDATNSADVLARVRAETGVELRVLSGAAEARLTFLAVRRWFGWSAGRLLVLDIGGGSLEVAYGIDEAPTVALSVPLGAGRLTRERLGEGDPPPDERVGELREYVAKVVDKLAHELGEIKPEKVAATSKTFRSLARLAGAAPSGAGIRAPRTLTRTGLHQVLGFVRRIPAARLAELDGVSPARAHQLLAGGVVAEETMRRLGLSAVDICPWALREGVILRQLDAPGRED